MVKCCTTSRRLYVSGGFFITDVYKYTEKSEIKMWILIQKVRAKTFPKNPKRRHCIKPLLCAVFYFITINHINPPIINKIPKIKNIVLIGWPKCIDQDIPLNTNPIIIRIQAINFLLFSVIKIVFYGFKFWIKKLLHFATL